MLIRALPWFAVLAVFNAALVASHAIAAVPQRPRLGNLVMNGSFEHNWFHHAFTDTRRFYLLHTSDAGVGEQDGNVDHWRFPNQQPAELWDTSVARTGLRSIRFVKAGSGAQWIRYLGETNAGGGGAIYSYFKPLPALLADQFARRSIVVGAWCKTDGVATSLGPKLSVRTDGPTPTEQAIAFSAGTHDWEYREVRLEHEDVRSPLYLIVTVSASGSGTVWFDDVTCEEETPDEVSSLLSDALDETTKSAPTKETSAKESATTNAEPLNRLRNGGFEAVDGDGRLRDWSQPKLWTWFPNSYYAFTGWSHFDANSFRGTATADNWLAHEGDRSLRMTVFPGDNFAIASTPIKLDQPQPRLIEIRAMVKADNLRTLEIMAQDEFGQWLPQGNFLGDAMREPGMHYNMGSTGSGTYDWFRVRKFVAPRKPVKSLTLWICARGFDGRIVPDKNIVGTLWVDDVQVLEHGAPQKPTATEAASKPAHPVAERMRVRDIDFGDRLWGDNRVRVLVEYTAKQVATFGQLTLELNLTDSEGEEQFYSCEARVIRPPMKDTPGQAVYELPYGIETLCKDWQQQYKLKLRWLAGGEGPSTEFYFGTPEKQLNLSVAGYYMYPDEPLQAFGNVLVSAETLGHLSRATLVSVSDGRETTLAELRDMRSVLAPLHAPDYINTRQMFAARIGAEGFTIHPWSEPQLDNALRVRLYYNEDGEETLLAESEPIRFGFLQRFPRPDVPEKIERTAVNSRGFLTINGQPYFPVYWRPHMDVTAPEANYYVTDLGYKTFDVTPLLELQAKKPPADDEVREKILAKVREFKGDPKFFQYEIGEGEMQLQGPEWPARVARCKQAIEWIRQADPNHIVNGPISWLVGHPGHDGAMASFVPEWDAIGVESSFDSRVMIDTVARPLMKSRQTAVLVGLETYFYQPEHVLRWRGYRAVLDGAAGIGLCPSGMLQVRPDKVNYLRGLNGEFRGLAPVIMADEPRDRITFDSKLIDVMEREHEGRRYLFAVRNKDDQGAISARFQFPRGLQPRAIKVRFEGRTIEPTEGGFADEFGSPQTVHVYEFGG